MENPQKNKFEDRLSTLPGDVIKHVMEFLPVRDAARTCVLSSKWRYVWADHPSLVLDEDFWKHIQQHISCKKCENIHYANIVSRILLYHVGYIQKFILDVGPILVRDVSVEDVSSNDVDSWLSSLCRRSLKVLHLNNSGSHGRYKYKLPFGVLLTSELTNLSLSYCYIKEAVGCFNYIQSLNLEFVNLDSVVLTTPLLTSLTMMGCICKSGFDISAPKLASLTLQYNLIVNLKTFFTCTDIKYVSLLSFGSSYLQADGKHMLELFALWPKISVFVVDGSSFKHLATGSTPADNDDILPLNLRRFVLLHVDLDSERISWILYLLKNSPLLHTFVIQFGNDLMNDIDEPVDLKMDPLRIVTMKGFTASRNQLLFVKILLKNAPLLEKLLVEEDQTLDLNERMKILRELFTLQRINPNTEIVFAPKLFSSKLLSGDA